MAMRRRLPRGPAMATYHNSLRFFFVDTPQADGITGSDVPSASSGSPLNLSGLSVPYKHPLTMGNFQPYGQLSDFSNDDGNRVFATGQVRSYDPAVLYADIRLQDVQGQQQQFATATDQHVASQGTAADSESDAVMREGRDKQGAAGAAVVAAAMLESRRGAEGVAMVPGHPLPVVFPRPDGLPPPLRFVKKFGPGQSQMARTRHRAKATDAPVEEDLDRHIYGEVMQSDGRVEAHSIRKSIVMQVRVLDEQKRVTKVRGFQLFSEISDTMPQRVIEGLENSGFACPTILQSASIPLLLAGRDIVAVAPNGSGKTVAYAVPSLAVLLKVQQQQQQQSRDVSCDKARPVVLVLCVSREMAQRTAAIYSSLGGEGVRVVAAYSTSEGDKQLAVLRDGCDVLVATPDRARELLAADKLSLSRVYYAVVDEVDKLFQIGAGDDVRSVMELVRRNDVPHQVSLWAAALTHEVEKLAKNHLAPLQNTVIVRSEEIANLNVKHILYPLTDREDRVGCIKRLYDCRNILKREQVVVYCAYKETAEALAAQITTALSAPSSLVKFVHSGIRSRKRNQILEEFKRGDVRILVGTDLGTRRLNVPDLEHIIHYDLPQSTDVFFLRMTHVGQSGRQGTSHTLLAPGDARVPMAARYVEQQTGQPLAEEIVKLIESIEDCGGEDDWTKPLIRFSDRASSPTKWRVRGRRHHHTARGDGGVSD